MLKALIITLILSRSQTPAADTAHPARSERGALPEVAVKATRADTALPGIPALPAVPGMVELPEVVVTATRLSLPASLSPWPIEVIRPAGSMELSGALRQSASTDVRAYGLEGQPAYFFLGGVTSTRVLVLADGVPLNSRTNGVIDLGMLALSPGSRIELVRGPLSALYGSAAIGGVINVIPSFDEGLSASLGLDRFLGLEAQASGSHRFGPLAARLSASSLSSPGIRSNDSTQRYNADAGLELKLKNGLTLGAGLGFTDRGIGVPGPRPDTSLGIPRFGDALSTSLYDKEHDDLLSSSLKASWNPTPGFSSTLKLYGLSQTVIYDQIYVSYNPDWTEYVALENDRYRDSKLGADLLLSSKLSFLNLAGGISVEREGVNVSNVSQDSASLDTTSNITWDASDIHLGSWVEGIAELGIFTPSLALRFDWSPQYDAALSPEAGLAVTLIPERLKLSAAYGQAFRAPTFNDLYWPWMGDSTLKPEHGQTATLAADAQLLHFLSFTASGSWKDIRDMISWLPDSAGVWKATNVDRVQILGTDAALKVRIADSLLLLSLSAAYNHAQETRTIVTYSDAVQAQTSVVTRQAAFIPPLMLKGSLTLRAWKGGKLSSSAAWTSSRVNYYSDYSAWPEVGVLTKVINPTLKLDASVSQTFLKLLTLEAGVANILDDCTAEQFGTEYTDLNYPTPGRNLYAKLSVSYR